MKILHVISTMSPRSGGPFFVVRDLTRYQVLAGLDVTVFSTNIDNPRGILDMPLNTPVSDNGVRIYYFPVQFKPLLVSLSLSIKLLKTLKDFDLLHIHGLYRFPTTFAAMVCRQYKVPYIISPHGSLDPYLYARSSYSILAKRFYERFFDLPNLNAASGVHYASAAEMAKARFLHLKAPCLVAPIGLDWKRFECLPPRGGMRDRLSLGDQPIILFLGRINFKKGLDLLVQAFSEVAARIENAVLLIVGPDNEGYSAVVRKWISELGITAKVCWKEMLSGPEVLEAYVDADVFVLPSYTENFGLAVVEAMACGLPVVISNQVDIWLEVSRAEAGIVVGLDRHEIAHAICEIIENKNLSIKVGANGRRIARDRFAYDRVVRDINRMYESVVKEKPIING